VAKTNPVNPPQEGTRGPLVPPLNSTRPLKAHCSVAVDCQKPTAIATRCWSDVVNGAASPRLLWAARLFHWHATGPWLTLSDSTLNPVGFFAGTFGSHSSQVPSHFHFDSPSRLSCSETHHIEQFQQNYPGWQKWETAPSALSTSLDMALCLPPHPLFCQCLSSYPR